VRQSMMKTVGPIAMNSPGIVITAEEIYGPA
jgi:hypothetical protein